jgi:hypothetical protein
MAMPMTMLNKTRNGSSRKSSSFASTRAIIRSGGSGRRGGAGGFARLLREGALRVVLAAVLRDRLGAERGDKVALAETDEADPAMAEGMDLEPVARTFVADHLNTFGR